MGILNFFKTLSKRDKTQLNETNNSNYITLDIKGDLYHINKEIFSLLYFTEGKYKNSNIIDPSTILLNLPLSHSVPEKQKYYPSYQDSSPAQRNSYLKWLESDLECETDIGNYFILLNALDRRILSNSKVEQSIKLLSKLLNKTNNESFKYYASADIAYTYFYLKRMDLIKDINLDKCIIELKALILEKLSVDDLIENATKFNFTNKRYIKKNREYFAKALSEVLTSKFGRPEFIFHFENINTLEKMTLHISNISLRKNYPTWRFKIPNPFSSELLTKEIYSYLLAAHEQVKAFLKIEQTVKKSIPSSTQTSSPASPTLTYAGATLNKKLPEYITSVKIKVVGKKRLNAETNYPVSTDKQILNSYQLIPTKSIQKLDPETLKYFDTDDIRRRNLLNYILPHYQRGILLYRLGKWDEAEKEWIKLIYLMPHAIDKLGIMYRKEKRFYDVVLITKEASKSKTIPYLYTTNITDEDINKAMENYEKNKNSDKSILKSEDFKGLKRK